MKNFYVCIKCGKKYPFTKDILSCENHSSYYGYLTIAYDYQNLSFPLQNKTSWEKYTSLLPIDHMSINFNEQKTPLMKINSFGKKYGFENLYVKDESKNPTGSFKDKESICAINQAIDWKINKLFTVSSGNAAVSTSAYAQKAKITCSCYVPKNLSMGKRFLINLFGGKIIECEGSYEEIYRKVIDEKYDGWNCTPGINPIKEEGIKIVGFEIWEEIGVPDVIVVPCGNGTLLFGIYKAFKELQILGVIDKLPKLIGVQIKNAAPLKIAFEQKRDFVTLQNIPDSIAEGIIAQESYSSPKVMLALHDTKGNILEVEENEIKIALQEIIHMESLLPEPTSAVVYAAIKKLSFPSNYNIVLIQSAGGLKNLKEIVKNNFFTNI